jgi:hypothetical protein
MKKRLLCMGLVAIVTQLFGSGCFFFHPVARWHANHPYGTYHHHPLLHPIQTRRAIFSGEVGGPGGVYPPYHGCCDVGVPVGYGGPGVEVVPTGVPTIGQPMPLGSGPKVIPSYELPHPMPAPKSSGGQ